MTSCNKYIFAAGTVEDHVKLSEIFDWKFRAFHDEFVDHLVMFGSMDMVSFLTEEKYIPGYDTIPMTKINTDAVTCAHIIGGIDANKPVLEFMLIDDFHENDIIGFIYHLHGDDIITDDYFLVQHVNNFPRKYRECVQIWKMKPGVTIDIINKSWA